MKRNWTALLDRILDKAEPAWLVVALVLTGFIYLLLLMRLFLCG